MHTHRHTDGSLRRGTPSSRSPFRTYASQAPTLLPVHIFCALLLPSSSLPAPSPLYIALQLVDSCFGGPPLPGIFCDIYLLPSLGPHPSSLVLFCTVHYRNYRYLLPSNSSFLAFVTSTCSRRSPSSGLCMVRIHLLFSFACMEATLSSSHLILSTKT